MTGEINSRPGLVLVLVCLLMLLGLGGIGGGIVMLIDPTGEIMGLPSGLLDTVPISDFFLPGLFLIFVMGVLPIWVGIGLWRRTRWGWLGAVVVSVLLILWIGFQIFLWGAPILLQVFYLALGFVLLMLSYYPPVRDYYRKAKSE